ncbi:MAG: putative toxin-antitoxin system toxin component, PIN family, partial [Bacteroidota bacterium]
MKIVLDTNVLSVAISKRSKYHPIYTQLQNGDYDLLITEDIILEYEEVIGRDLNPIVAAIVKDALEILPNVQKITKYYYWQLIINDPDDDKFVDCAIAGRADFLVTIDRHFNVLKNVP